MRNLFLTLVLANLTFAAWHSWFASGRSAPVAQTDADVPDILLASELERQVPPVVPEPRIAGEARETSQLDPGPGDAGADPDALESIEVVPDAIAFAPPEASEPEVAGAPAAAAPARSLAPQSCTTVGPFRDLAQAATAAANLRGAGFEPVQRVGEGDIWVGYWVYIAAIPSAEDADAILATLQASGISDSYVIPNSDSGSLVSLGVFTEIARAGNRLSAVRELGYEATVADRTRRGTVYWIDVLLADDQSLDFDLLQPPGRIIRLEQQPCADVAAAR